MTLAIKSASQFRDDIITSERNAYYNQDILDPDTGPGTEPFIFASALGLQLNLLATQQSVSIGKVMPLTARGSDLDQCVSNVGMVRHVAGPSAGTIVFSTNGGSVLVPSDTQLQDSLGRIYKVLTGGTFANGNSISIVSDAVGFATNLAEDEILRWVSTPSGAKSTARIGAGGLTGGTDPETDPQLLARFIAFCQDPPVSGNASHLNIIAEGTTKGIKSVCYPAHDGPGTAHVAVYRAPSATNKDRDVDSGLLTGVIQPLFLAEVPEHDEYTITTVENVSTDLALGLVLADGEWVDAIRFPSPVNGKSEITTLISSTRFTVHSAIAPTAGVSSIAYLNPSDWNVYRAKVSSFASAGTNLYDITIDSPLPGVAVGSLISADATNIEEFFGTMLNSFAALGPGEETDAAGLLPRALRKPRPVVSAPYSIGASFDKAMTNLDNVLDSDILYSTHTTPDLPSNIGDPPLIFVPRYLAIYDRESL